MFVKWFCNKIFHLAFHILLSANEPRGSKLIFSDSPPLLQPQSFIIIIAGFVKVPPVDIQDDLQASRVISYVEAQMYSIEELEDVKAISISVCWCVQAHMAHY